MYDVLPIKADQQFVSAYISQLRQHIGYYIPYITQTLSDDLTESSFVEILEKDEQIWRCTNLLALKVAGEQVVVGVKDPVLSGLFSWFLEEVDDLLHAIVSLTEKSLILGLGIQRKYYKKTNIPGFKGMFYVPCRFQEVDRRRLRIERDKDDKNYLRWTIWSANQDSYIVLQDRNKCREQPILGAGLQDYIWYWNRIEEEYPYGFGLGEVLFRTAYIKHNLLQYYAKTAEAWSEPFIFAYTEAGKAAIDAELGSGLAQADSRVRELMTVLEKTKSKHNAVFDSSDKIEFKEMGSTGTNIIQNFIDYCDKKQLLIILGSELATDAAATGSYGQGSIHNQQIVTNARYHRKRLMSCLKRQLFYDIISRNKKLIKQNLGYIPTLSQIGNFYLESEDERLKKLALEQNLQEYKGNLENVIGGVT